MSICPGENTISIRKNHKKLRNEKKNEYRKFLSNEAEKLIEIPIISRQMLFYIELIRLTDDVIIGKKRKALVIADINKSKFSLLNHFIIYMSYLNKL